MCVEGDEREGAERIEDVRATRGSRTCVEGDERIEDGGAGFGRSLAEAWAASGGGDPVAMRLAEPSGHLYHADADGPTSWLMARQVACSPWLRK